MTQCLSLRVGLGLTLDSVLDSGLGRGLVCTGSPRSACSISSQRRRAIHSPDEMRFGMLPTRPSVARQMGVATADVPRSGLAVVSPLRVLPILGVDGLRAAVTVTECEPESNSESVSVSVSMSMSEFESKCMPLTPTGPNDTLSGMDACGGRDGRRAAATVRSSFSRTVSWYRRRWSM